jgi:hypothetical protein
MKVAKVTNTKMNLRRTPMTEMKILVISPEGVQAVALRMTLVIQGMSPEIILISIIPGKIINRTRDKELAMMTQVTGQIKDREVKVQDKPHGEITVRIMDLEMGLETILMMGQAQ